MGQRLNIEIHKNGELLANSYFHWSAYTSSSIELVQDILAVYDKIISNNPIQRAVRMLEATGAGITEDEKSSVAKEPNRLLNSLRFFRTSNDRNQGFIHILSQPMLNTRDWDEGRVIIDIGDDTIVFGVLYIDTVEYVTEELEWDELPKVYDLQTMGLEIGEAWPIDRFQDFVDLYTNNPEGIRYINPIGDEMVAYWVE